ncbi:MAG: alpha/beta hydrolase, partial [Terracidiphilus sp.]
VLKVVPESDCKRFEKAYTPAFHVKSDDPPTFIYATSDDRVVPVVQASVDFYEALVAAGVPVEMHLFEQGRHGSGLGQGSPSLDAWPVLLEQWLREQGLLISKDAAQPLVRTSRQ